MIIGVVVDSASQARLSQVSVELQEMEKSRTLENTLTDKNGFFAFTALTPEKQYRLILKYEGYRDITLPVSPSATTAVQLGQVALVSLAIQLRPVQVASQKRLLEQSLDKLAYNVEADPESKTASALDILRKIPMLSVDADDNVRMNGNSNYRVLVNGKSSALFWGNPSETFKNLAASAIKSIEVITIPPSRYEASGAGGIINIVTYKENIKGYNGGVNVRFTDPKGLSTNGNIMAEAGRFGLSGNFGHNYSTSPTARNNLLREDKLQHSQLKQTGSSNSHNRSLNGSAEIRYALNERNTITVGYGARTGNSTSNFTQQVELFNAQNEPVETYRRLNDSRNQQHSHDLNVDYQRSFKNNEDRLLTLTYHLSNTTQASNGQFTLQPLPLGKKAISLTDNKDKIREQLLQGDYIQPLKKHTLELGISSQRRQNSSDYFYKDRDTATGAFVLDTAQSNNFNFQEDIKAGYTSLTLKMGKWGLKTGIRLEAANIDAHFITSSTTTRRQYVNLIPNLTLSRQLKGISTLRLSYTQRLQRPDLYYMDPYVDRTDPWNLSYGNPRLQPALGHAFQLGYNTFFKKTSINLNVYHQFTNNAIQQFTVLAADTVAHTTFGNIGRNQNTSFSLGLNTTFFKKLDISLNGNTNYAEYTSTIKNKTRTRKGLIYSTSGTATLRLKTWRFSSSMSYNAPNILVQGRSASYISNSATLNKFFLKNNKATVALSVSSPFHQYRRSFTEIDEPAFYQLRSSNTVIRRITLSFNYRFAKL